MVTRRGWAARCQARGMLITSAVSSLAARRLLSGSPVFPADPPAAQRRYEEWGLWSGFLTGPFEAARRECRRCEWAVHCRRRSVALVILFGMPRAKQLQSGESDAAPEL